MIDEPPPFKGLNIRIPIIIPIQGRGLVNQGSTLPLMHILLSADSGDGKALHQVAHGTALGPGSISPLWPLQCPAVLPKPKTLHNPI